MNKVWGSDAITDQGDLCILLALADWSDDEGRCWPSLTQLARKSRSHRATVIRRLAAMRGHWIEWDENDGGRSRRNQYRLNLENILTPLPDDFKQSHDATVSEEPKQSHGATVSEAETVARCDQKQSHGATRNKPSSKPSGLSTAEPNRGGGSTSAREDPDPPPVDDALPAFVEDSLEWLTGTDAVYAPTISEKLATYRPSSGAELLIHLWRRQAQIPFSSVAALLRSYPWPVYVAAVVIAADDNRPTLRFLQSILDRLNHEYTRTKKGADANDPHPGGSPSASALQVSQAGTGREMLARVHPGRHGGGAQTPGRPAPARRRGEGGAREFLINSGFPPEQIAALSDQEIEHWVLSPHPGNRE